MNKSFMKSATLRGILATLLAGIAPRFGIAVDGIPALVDAAMLVGGAVYAAWGRWRVGGLRVY